MPHVVFTADDVDGSMLAPERGTAADRPVFVATDRLDFDQVAIELWRKYWHRSELAVLKDLCSALRVACFAGKGVGEISKAAHDHCFLPPEIYRSACMQTLRLIPGATEVIGGLSAYARRAVLEHADAALLSQTVDAWLYADSAGRQLYKAFGLEVAEEVHGDKARAKGNSLPLHSDLAFSPHVLHRADCATLTAGMPSDIEIDHWRRLEVWSQLRQLMWALQAGLPGLRLDCVFSDDGANTSQSTGSEVADLLHRQGQQLCSLSVAKGWHGLCVPSLGSLLSLDLAHDGAGAVPGLQADASFPELRHLAITVPQQPHKGSPISARSMPQLRDLYVATQHGRQLSPEFLDLTSFAPQLKRAAVPLSSATLTGVCAAAANTRLRALWLQWPEEHEFDFAAALASIAACQPALHLLVLDGLPIAAPSMSALEVDAHALAQALNKFKCFHSTLDEMGRPCADSGFVFVLPPSELQLHPRDPHEVIDTDSEEHWYLHATSAVKDELRLLRSGVHALLEDGSGGPVRCNLDRTWWPELDPCKGMLQAAYGTARSQRALWLHKQRLQEEAKQHEREARRQQCAHERKRAAPHDASTGPAAARECQAVSAGIMCDLACAKKRRLNEQ